MNKNYQKMMKNDKKMKKNSRHSPFLIVSEAAQFFINFLSFCFINFLSFSKETEENE